MISGVLLDLGGVLFTEIHPLRGALDAVERLTDVGLTTYFITSNTHSTRRTLGIRMAAMGFDVAPEDIFTPPCAAHAYLKAHHLRPYLFVHPQIEGEFLDLAGGEPNAVLLGEAGTGFSYERLNRAFRLVMEGAPLLAMGTNRHFQEHDGPSLDVGPFVAALEYATERHAIVLGKPAAEFFHAAVAKLDRPAAEVVVVGDDWQADVAGALGAGLQALLVRTGKYRPGDEERIDWPAVACVTDVEAAVDWILDHRA
jgi:HAD superfamily hydrolase (TIGR01458 family)